VLEREGWRTPDLDPLVGNPNGTLEDLPQDASASWVPHVCTRLQCG